MKFARAETRRSVETFISCDSSSLVQTKPRRVQLLVYRTGSFQDESEDFGDESIPQFSRTAASGLSALASNQGRHSPHPSNIQQFQIVVYNVLDGCSLIEVGGIATGQSPSAQRGFSALARYILGKIDRFLMKLSGLKGQLITENESKMPLKPI